MQPIRPSPNYSLNGEERYRAEVLREFERCHKKDERFIRTSPNGKKWSLGVDDSGNTTWTEL
jgi:hypothetical protein